jgi:hypothetical protein
MPFKSPGGVHLIICGAKVDFAKIFLMPQPPLLTRRGRLSPILVDSNRNSFIPRDMAPICYLRTISTVDVLAILPPVSQTDSARSTGEINREEDACNRESPFAAAVAG